MIRHFLAIAACLCITSLCSADVIVQFGQGGVVGGLNQNYEVGPGGTLTLDIFMTQRGRDPGIPQIGDYRLSDNGGATRGLGSYYLELAASNTANGLNQTGVRADLGAFTFRSGFDGRTNETAYITAPNGNVQAAPTSTVRLVGIAADNPGVADPAIVLPRFAAATDKFVVGDNIDSVADNSIRLGTVTFNIAADALGVYNLGFSAPGSISRSTLGTDFLGGQFDVNFAGNLIAATVTVVPEPATVALFSICAGGLGFARFRRKAVKK